MAAPFIANGPSFRRGLRLPGFHNVHVYPLLARLIGWHRIRTTATPPCWPRPCVDKRAAPSDAEC